MNWIIGTAIVVILVSVWYIATYNRFVAKRNRIKQCESGICVVLKQRNDLIPNLVSVVKGYARHEQQTLTEITRLRLRALEASGRQEQIALGNRISATLPPMQILRENYPGLKADKHFTQLAEAIDEMELQLQAIRRTYNAAVVDYNNSVEMFPSSIVAGRHHYVCAGLIDIPAIEQNNPLITFTNV